MDFQVQIDGIRKKAWKKNHFSKAASSGLYLFCDELSGHHSQINSYSFKIVNFDQVMIKVNLVKGLWRFIQIKLSTYPLKQPWNPPFFVEYTTQH